MPRAKEESVNERRGRQQNAKERKGKESLGEDED